jgi:cellulose synthase/poly-beta-1,6-N-acetylglucosamine synthase-like glycosyltransferase
MPDQIDAMSSRASGAAEDPLISILIPSHGRPERLASCLEALARQDFPREKFEVIVCDDGTSMPLEQQLAPLLQSLGSRMSVRIVRQKQSGPAAARNRAASVARGRLLAFTDDDCLPAPDWVSRFASHHTKDPDVLIGGGLRNGLPGNVWSTATQLIMDCAYSHQMRDQSRMQFFSTSNIAVSAAHFRRLGGFSENYRLAAGEDYDFSARWQQDGRRAAYLPQAVVDHVHVLSFRRFLRQHHNYGRGLFRVRQAIARRNATAMRVSKLGFYASLVAHAFRQGRGMRRFTYAALVVLSQAAALSGALYEAIVVGGPAPHDPEPLLPQADK